MEYTQITLDDWVSMKEKLKQDLIGVQESFVRIGYRLRLIEEQELYKKDGHASITEFAMAEYGLSRSTISRFMAINKKFSIDGYSEQLRPEFATLGSSKLSEMLTLPDEDMQMIQGETRKEDIRELKAFNKSEPAAGEADEVHELIEKFFEDNKELLNSLYSSDAYKNNDIKQMSEIVNPGGNKSYKKGIFFLMLYENAVKIKKFGTNPTDMTWETFFETTNEVFENDIEGDKTYTNHFGEEVVEETPVAPAQKTPKNLEENSVLEEEKEEKKDEGNNGEDGATYRIHATSDSGRDIQGNTAQISEHDDRREEEHTRSDSNCESEGSGEIPRIQEEYEEEQSRETEELLPNDRLKEEESDYQEVEELEEELVEVIEEQDVEVVDEEEVVTRHNFIGNLSPEMAAIYLKSEFAIGEIDASTFTDTEMILAWLQADVDKDGMEV